MERSAGMIPSAYVFRASTWPFNKDLLSHPVQQAPNPSCRGLDPSRAVQLRATPGTSSSRVTTDDDIRRRLRTGRGRSAAPKISARSTYTRRDAFALASCLTATYAKPFRMGITASLFRSTGQTTDNEFNLQNARDESVESVSAEPWLWNAPFPLTPIDLSGPILVASDATSNWNPESHISWQLTSGPWSIVREPGASRTVVRNGPHYARGTRRSRGAPRGSKHPSTGTAVGTVLDSLSQPSWLYDVVPMDLWNPNLIDLLQLRVQRSFKSTLNEACSVEDCANETLPDGSATHEEALLTLLLHLLWLPNSRSSTCEHASSELIRYSMNTPWSQACPSLTRQDIWALCVACLQASLYAPCAHGRQRDATDKPQLLNDLAHEAIPGTPDSSNTFRSHVISRQTEWNGAQSRDDAAPNKSSTQFGKQTPVQEERHANIASSCVLCYCLRKRFLLRLRRDMAVTRWLLMMLVAEHGGLCHRLPAWVANVPLCIGSDSLKHIEQLLSRMLGAAFDVRSFSCPCDDLAGSPWIHSIGDIECASTQQYKIRGHNRETRAACNVSTERVSKGSKAPLEEIQPNKNDEEVLSDGICPRQERSSRSSAWDRFRQSCAQARHHVSYDPLQHDLFADGCLSLPFEKLFDVAALFQSLSVLTRRSRTLAVLNDPIGGEMNPVEGCSLRAHSERQRQIQETQQLASESIEQASASKSSESKYSSGVALGRRSHGGTLMCHPCSCRGSPAETRSLGREVPNSLNCDLVSHHEHDRTREPPHTSSSTGRPLPTHEPATSFQEGLCFEDLRESMRGPRPHSSPGCMHKRHRQDTNEEQRKSLLSSQQGRRRTHSLHSFSGARCRFASSLDDHQDAFMAGAWNAERDHPLRGDLKRLERYVHALEQVTDDLERLMDSFKVPTVDSHRSDRHRKSASSPSLSTPIIPSCSRSRSDRVLNDDDDPKSTVVFDPFETQNRTRQPLMDCFHGLVRDGILSVSLYPIVCVLSKDDHTAWFASNETTCNESLSAVNGSQGSTSGKFGNSAVDAHCTRMQNSRPFLLTPFWLACTASAAFKSYWGSFASSSSLSNEQPRLLNQDSFHRGSSLMEQPRHSPARFWTRRSNTTTGQSMTTSPALADSSTSTEAIFVGARFYSSGAFPSAGSCRGYTIVYRYRETADASMSYATAAESTSPTQVSAKAPAMSPLSVVPDASAATLATTRRDSLRSMDQVFQDDSAARASEAMPHGSYPWGSLSSTLTGSPTDESGVLSEGYRSPERTRRAPQDDHWSPLTNTSDLLDRESASRSQYVYEHHDRLVEGWASLESWTRTASPNDSAIVAVPEQSSPLMSLESPLHERLEMERPTFSSSSVSPPSWQIFRPSQDRAKTSSPSEQPVHRSKLNMIGADHLDWNGCREQGTGSHEPRHRVSAAWSTANPLVRIQRWPANPTQMGASGEGYCFEAWHEVDSSMSTQSANALDGFSKALFAVGAHHHPRVRKLIRTRVPVDADESVTILGFGCIPPSLQSLCAQRLVEKGSLTNIDAVCGFGTDATSDEGSKAACSPLGRSFQRVTQAAAALIRTGERSLAQTFIDPKSDVVSGWASLPAPIMALCWDAACCSGNASPALLRLYARGVAPQLTTARWQRPDPASPLRLLWIRQAPLPHMQHFRVPVHDRARFQDEWLFALVPSAASLEHLDLSGCGQVTDRGLIALAPHLRQLRVCILEGCLGLWGPGVQALLRSCLRLETLYLRGCRSLTDAAFGREPFERSEQAETGLFGRPTLQTGRCLKHLDLSECVQLTDEGLLALKSALDASVWSLEEPNGARGVDTVLAADQWESTATETGFGPRQIHSDGYSLAHQDVWHEDDEPWSETHSAGTLETFSVAHCFRLGDRSLRPLLAQHRSSLRSINLSYTAITAATLDDLAALPHLEALSLRGCGDTMLVDAVAATRFGERLAGPGKQLHCLDLGKCSRLVTDGFLAALAGVGTTSRPHRGEHLIGARDTLKSLSLHATRLTDRSLSHYVRLFRSLERLDLSQCTLITDAGVEHLQSLKALTELDLADTGVTSAVGSTLLCRLSQLRKLDLSYTAIQNSVTRSLSTLEHLEWLGLDARLIGDDALQVLETEANHSFESERPLGCTTSASVALHLHRRIGLPRNLRHLDLFSAHVTDRGIAYLVKACPFLETLEVCSGALTDAALRMIAQHLPYLESLNVSQNMRISDAGLREYAKLAQLQRDLDQPLLLRSLNVAFTAVTWRGLAALLPMLPHLRLLCVRGCNKDSFSAATVQSLERIRPGLVILGADEDASAKSDSS